MIQASLPIRAVSPEPSLLAHTSSESRGTFRQKARSLAPLNGWACAVKICHDGMLEDTNSLDRAHLIYKDAIIGSYCGLVVRCTEFCPLGHTSVAMWGLHMIYPSSACRWWPGGFAQISHSFTLKHMCHISHCEIKCHIIWPIWKQIPTKFFKSH